MSTAPYIKYSYINTISNLISANCVETHFKSNVGTSPPGGQVDLNHLGLWCHSAESNFKMMNPDFFWGGGGICKNTIQSCCFHHFHLKYLDLEQQFIINDLTLVTRFLKTWLNSLGWASVLAKLITTVSFSPL